MNHNERRPERAIVCGLIVSSLIVLFAAHLASRRISDALVVAGARARSHLSGGSTHIPQPLIVRMQDSPKQLTPEDRERFITQFVDAVVGARPAPGSTIGDENGVDAVFVRSVSIDQAGGRAVLNIEGSVTFEGCEDHFDLKARFVGDGFGSLCGGVNVRLKVYSSSHDPREDDVYDRDDTLISDLCLQ